MSSNKLPSLAVFCPQTRAPQKEYLDELLSFIRCNPHLQKLAIDAKSLDQTWDLLARQRDDIAALDQGPLYLKALSDWITKGQSEDISNKMSGIIALPLLVIIQVTQYFQFLHVAGINHVEFLACLGPGHGGGIQGYCAGLLPAVSIACAANEEEIVKFAGNAMRLGVIMGAYAELGDDLTLEGTTSIVVRIKHPNQGQELVQQFPGAYIGAVTDPKTLGIVGPADTLRDMTLHARKGGLIVQEIQLRGKNHNPENIDFVAEICELCERFDNLRLPHSNKLLVPVNSNMTGKPMSHPSLTHELVLAMLASKCDWYTLIKNVAHSMTESNTGTNSHTLIMFGIGDPVPLLPFHEARLSMTKIEASAMVSQGMNDQIEFQDEAIAVIGASCRLPGAKNLDELWELMLRGQSMCTPVPPDRAPLMESYRLSQDSNLSKRKFFGNFIDDIHDFDYAFFQMNAKEAAAMDPQQRILLELAYESLDSSGYLRHHQRSNSDRVGCFIGASSQEYTENTNSHTPTAYTATGTLRAFLCGKISHYFGWSGPSETVDTACSSSLVAIHRACRAILAGECSLALAGGVNVITGVNNFLDLSKAGFLSPTGQCKPFDEAADGYCRADGAGLVVLKALKSAVADRDQILGVISGIATNQGGLSSTLIVPHAPSQVDLYHKILAQAGLEASRVTYVEAHGPGTQAGDPVEMSGLRKVFGGSSRPSPLYVGSIKGNVGHTGAASGVVGLLKVLAMLSNGKIPPLANHQRLNPKIEPLEADNIVLPRQTQAWGQAVRIACISSYGAAGSNAALLCCNSPVRLHPPLGQANFVPILLSASTKDALLSYAAELYKFLGRSEAFLNDIAYTLADRRKPQMLRWSTVVSSVTQLRESLKTISLDDISEAPQNPQPVVLAFGGQTRRVVGLNKLVYDTNPRLRYHIQCCNTILTELGFPSVIPAIFDNQPLSDIVVLQCGTFSVQYAFGRCWIDSGLRVDATVGHSFGELTALVISGALTLRDGIKFVATRASLIASKWGPERGNMLAVHASPDHVHELVSHIGNGLLEIACYNSNTNLVLVGSAEAIALAERTLAVEPRFSGIRYQRLDVSHGFHSEFTDPMLPALLETARELSFRKPIIHLETCTQDALSALSAEYMVQHTRNPVYFVSAAQRVESSLGVCTWLESGLDSGIIPMLKRACGQKNHHFQAISLHGGQYGETTVPSVVAALWRQGIPTSFWSFFSQQNPRARSIWLPPYHFSRVKVWTELIDRASENQKQCSIISHDAPVPVAPSQLVTFHTETEKGMHFLVNIHTDRFTRILSGHAVCGRPLCPAFMYVECATMAVQISCSDLDFSNTALCFENLHFGSPLGLKSSKRYSLTLEKSSAHKRWAFSMWSSPEDLPASRHATLHGTGLLRMDHQPKLGAYETLVSSRLRDLELQGGTEILETKRAYALFSHMVSYSEMFWGIRTITMGRSEASAVIQVPEGHVGAKESTAIDLCDTISLDVWVHVLGLLLNSSDNCPPGHIFVATGVKNAVMTSECRFIKHKSWKVYAVYALRGESKAQGDVFVLSPDEGVVAVVEGVEFTKLPMVALQRMLDGVNEPKDCKQPPTQEADLSTNSAATSSPTLELNSKVWAYDQVDVRPDIPTSQSPPAVVPPEVSSMQSHSEQLMHGSIGSAGTSAEGGPSHSKRQVIARDLIHEMSGADLSKVDDEETLRGLGVDSLAIVQLKGDLESAFSMELGDDEFSLDMKLRSIWKMIGAVGPPTRIISQEEPENGIFPSDTSASAPATSTPGSLTWTEAPARSQPYQESSGYAGVRNPAEVLAQSEELLASMAEHHGFGTYWKHVARRQGKILLAYILEAYRESGVDLSAMESGGPVPLLPHLPRHDRLVARLLQVLQKYSIIENSGGPQWKRTPTGCPEVSSKELTRTFIDDFPQYRSEANLMSLMGPSLAASLRGDIDPLALMFSSRESQEVLADFYTNSPLLATATDFLVDVVCRSVNLCEGRTVRIIEIGAGFGGTTTRLMEEMRLRRIKVEYCFTDISPTLVSRASRLFGSQGTVSTTFHTLDIENPPPENLRNRFDLCISTNCLHATRDRVNAIVNIKDLLNPQGFVILSEGAELIDWHEIIWGLLEGWWLARDLDHPLQPPDHWMQCFRKAGLGSTYSQGLSRDLNTMRLLIGSQMSAVTPLRSVPSIKPYIRTVVYKEVDGIEIHADIYLPRSPPSEPMPVALLIHGGGHMTLSRRAVRPAQCAFLLANGVLPISLDYRLCPEVNLLDGAILDIRDAHVWARNGLSDIVKDEGISLDTTRIVTIGWSTGGHLAMTSAWTLKEAGYHPPTAILSFYGPTDYETIDVNIPLADKLPRRQMSTAQAVQALPQQVVTNHESGSNPLDTSDFGWVKPGDPRSELLLSFWYEGHGLAMILNGFSSGKNWHRKPSTARVAAISPLSQVRRGNMTTPTFLVHSTHDQIVPYHSALSFVEEMRRQSVECGLLTVDGAKHIHDLELKPGTLVWEAEVAPAYEFLFKRLDESSEPS
ncbi:BcPKS16, polyketide synthase [Stachybotrys elegans]|uniref:BcPKS16, polyketide synthase n=1 Tax=Stachybotrys elegans TaxID=80388 RepID=A0A8K0SH69_9HYPO|nr:BcPKS16, polyketide synthase [Stachybotrys elegans]